MLGYLSVGIIAFVIAALILMYGKNVAVVYMAFPFICYFFGSFCYTVCYVCEYEKPLAFVLGMFIELTLIVIYVLPMTNEDSIFAIPLGMMWIGSLLYWAGLSNPVYDHYSDVILNICFYILAFIFVMGVIMSIGHIIRMPMEEIVTNFSNAGLGCGIIILMSLLPRVFAPVGFLCIFLFLNIAVSVMTARDIIPVELNPFVMLPIFILWILKPITFSNEINQLFVFKGATLPAGFCKSPFMDLLENRFSVGTLGGFAYILNSALYPVFSKFMSLFGITVNNILIPDLLVILFAFMFTSMSFSVSKWERIVG